MAARKNPGVTIPYFRTGLYTHRSQLFAPMRSMGINVIQMKDALIDGQDMEVTDLLEVTRRPGFSRFCSQQLAAGEIINQFGETGDGSIRLPDGTVIPTFDSNQRVAKFSASAITTIWTKPSANQAFLKAIGTQIYMCNGTTDGQKRFDTATNAMHANGIVGPVTAPTLIPPVIAGPTFWQPSITYGAVNAFLLDVNGNIQVLNTAGTTGAAQPIWNPILKSLTTDGTMKWQNLGAPFKWAPGIVVVTPPNCVVDSNGNLQIAGPGGTAGGTEPIWNAAIGGTTADGTITWTNFGYGSPVVFAGFVYVYVYSTQAPTVTTGYYHCSTASPAATTTGTVFATSYSQVVKGAFSTNADVTSVDIYRTKDGGSLLSYAGSVANNIAGGIWSFTDAVIDNNLLTQTAVPLAGFHRNDVMPGMTGSIAPSTDKAGYLEYWNGRMWTIAGGKVYFSAGPDCQNGDPNASWPPANVFTFPGQPLAITPTSAGLLVWLNNAIKIIAGGPATLSFFAVDVLQSMGISSPNCVDKDGDIIRIITTQGQQFTLTVSDRMEDGNFVADILGANFAPAASYITTHRNGLDSGVFLSDGSATVMRHGLNIGAWSPQYKPVGGIKALRSIETSTGKYTLCAGRASAAGFILGRDLTTVQDDGVNYSNCFATVGNITLSEPLQPLTNVDWICGYFAAVGSTPTVDILPNEISGTSGIGFLNLTDPVDELGAAPSTTLMAKRWSTTNTTQKKTSTLYHHLQVRISFPQENFANTIKLLAIGPEPER